MSSQLFLIAVLCALFCSLHAQQTVPSVTYVSSTAPNTTFAAVIDNDSNLAYFAYRATAPSADVPFALRVTLIEGANITAGEFLTLRVAACATPDFEVAAIDFETRGAVQECDTSGVTGDCFVNLTPTCGGTGGAGVQSLYYIEVESSANFNGIPLDFTLNIFEGGVAVTEISQGTVYLANQTITPGTPELYSFDVSGLTAPFVLTLTATADTEQIQYSYRVGAGQGCTVSTTTPDTVSGSEFFAQLTTGTSCDLYNTGEAVPSPVFIFVTSFGATNFNLNFQARSNPTSSITTLQDGVPRNATVTVGRYAYFTIADVTPNAPLRVTVTLFRDGDVVVLSIDRTNQFFPSESCNEDSESCQGNGAQCEVNIDPCELAASAGPVRIAVSAALVGDTVNPVGPNSTVNEILFEIVAEYLDPAPAPTTAITLTADTANNETDLQRDEWYDFRIPQSALNGAYAVGYSIELFRTSGVAWEGGNQADIIFSRGAITRDGGCPASIELQTPQLELLSTFTGTEDWNCGELGSGTGDLFISLRVRSGPGDDTYFAILRFFAVVPRPLTLGTTLTGVENSDLAGVPNLFSFSVSGVGEVVVTITTAANDSTVVFPTLNLFDYLESSLCDPAGFNPSTIAHPAPNTTVVRTTWQCLGDNDLVLSVTSNAGRFDYDILVEVEDSSTQYVINQSAPLVVTLAAGEQQQYYFTLSSAQSIIVSAEGQNGGYSLQLFRASDCDAHNQNCGGQATCTTSVSRPADGGAGRWYLQVGSNNQPNTIQITITLGLDNCNNVTLSGTNFCFDTGVTTTKVFGNFNNNANLDYGPHLVNNAYDALPGTTTACLDALARYLCSITYPKCDSNGWQQDIAVLCNECRSVEDECASSGACIVSGICTGICTGISSSTDGDGDAATVLRSCMLNLLL